MDISKRLRHLWHTYGSLNNIVMVVALLIAASWAWGSISIMQTNFDAQKVVDDQKRQLELTQLQVDTLQYQQNYYNSDEYKDLAAREDLGLASPGEKELILPPNSAKAKQEDNVDAQQQLTQPTVGSAQNNFDQWMGFLLGTTAGSLKN